MGRNPRVTLNYRGAEASNAENGIHDIRATRLAAGVSFCAERILRSRDGSVRFLANQLKCGFSREGGKYDNYATVSRKINRGVIRVSAAVNYTRGAHEKRLRKIT